MNIDISNAHCGPRIRFPDHAWLRVVQQTKPDCSSRCPLFGWYEIERKPERSSRSRAVSFETKRERACCRMRTTLSLSRILKYFILLVPSHHCRKLRASARSDARARSVGRKRFSDDGKSNSSRVPELSNGRTDFRVSIVVLEISG